ncbi:MAG: M28 family peptidase [Acidobacteriia bacterium]|nr:M28 family peptidase [Terriglobia bacterium]
MKCPRIGPFALSVCIVFLLGGGCGASSGSGDVRTNAPAAIPAAAPVDQAANAPSPEATGGFDGRRALAHVARLTQIGPRQSGTPGIAQAQQYILAELKSYGCTAETDDFHADTPAGSLAMKNILVKIPGERQDIVLLTTHYDTKRLENFVGADDGGSSTGVMLELARLLCGRRGRDTVWIAFFDGEEAVNLQWADPDNCYGSRQMAARLAASGDLKRIKALLLADIVGSRNLRIRRESASTRWLTDLVWSVAARLGYGSVFVREQTSIEDDHISFLRRGVPAVDVIDLETSASYWHTPQDTLDKLSARSLAVVGHVFLETVKELERQPR